MDRVTLRCSYETSSEYVDLYWYRQFPNSEPQYLLWKGARSRDGSSNIPDPHFESSTTRTSTELIIKAVALKDSALYYCALWKDPVIQSLREAVQKHTYFELKNIKVLAKPRRIISHNHYCMWEHLRLIR